MDETPAIATGTGDAAALHRALLAWFQASRRDLPWRRRRSLYGTWISEMMLQQTTVATVVPYWERFLARFPDVRALAAADEAEVLAMWSGLGYYRRARQLLAAAREIVSARGGELPGDVDGWRSLPGIGAYAAGAIASIGLGLPEPAVDANVRRVVGRWLGPGEGGAAPAAAVIGARAAALVPESGAGDWNEALMELGATVCLPRDPRCGDCPVAGQCRSAGATGTSATAPAPAPPRAVPVGVVLVAWMRAGQVWLEPAGAAPLPCEAGDVPARADFSGLHQGLLALPMTAWYPLPAMRAAQAGALAALVRGLGFPAAPGGPGATFRHAITRYRLLAGVVVRPADGPAGAPPRPGRPEGEWVDVARAPGLHVTQLTRKALRLIDPPRG